MTLSRLSPLFYLFSLLGIVEMGREHIPYNLSGAVMLGQRTDHEPFKADEETDAVPTPSLPAQFISNAFQRKLGSGPLLIPESIDKNRRETFDPKEMNSKDMKEILRDEPQRADEAPPPFPDLTGAGAENGWYSVNAPQDALAVPEPRALMLISLIVIAGLTWRKICGIKVW